MKSHVSTLLEVAICIYNDVIAKCATIESAKRDIETLVSRVENEGLSFLTITLPAFVKDFERSLDEGQVAPEYFRSFRKYRKIPAFLRDIFGLVFDADTGRIKDVVSIEAVQGIRQIGNTFNKLKLNCSLSRTKRAYRQYIDDEQVFEQDLDPADAAYFDSVSRACWDWLYSSRHLSLDLAIPKQGPGSTSERIVGNSKYVFRSWHKRLEPYFPIDSNALVNINALDSPEFRDLELISEEHELPSRLVDVPKTQKTPRLIAIEPVCMQYTQQAIQGILVRALEDHRLTAGHVNFTDQSVNRDLALSSSSTGLMATLDLSSASDRVPLSLVERMFRYHPDIWGAIEACRTRKVQFPDGKIFSIKKFASMGSALCFPVESMYFYTICIGALLKKHNLPVTYRNVFKMSRYVYVYGDDIIVPTDDVGAVIDHLQKYYCKVNVRKSFWNGKFRESCGMDAYNGYNVSVTYIRTMPPNNRRQTNEIVSWVKTAQLFDKDACYLTSDYLYKVVESILGSLPFVDETSACLGRLTCRRSYSVERMNTKLHEPEIFGYVVKPVYRKDKLDGYPALLKCLLDLERRKETSSSSDKRHLERSARFGAVALKRRWTRPY